MAKEKKTQDSNKEERPYYGAVFYSDGGCRPGGLGHTGYGIHGYFYSDLAPTQGSGHPTQRLTSTGYQPKAGLPDRKEVVEVKPTFYVNAYGSMEGIRTNNQAELDAAFQALQLAKDQNVQEVLILTDSQQTVQGMNGRVETWMKNNWIRSNGEPVKNIPDWKNLYQALTQLRDTGTKVTFKWVRGHDGNFGNERADQLATLGTILSRQGKIVNERTFTPAKGYWNRKTTHHPLLGAPYAYDRTDTPADVGGRYLLGNFGFDDEEIELQGKPVADTWFAHVKLDEANEVLEHLRASMRAQSPNELRAYVTDLRVALKADFAQAFDEYGPNSVIYDDKTRRRNFVSLAERPISKEYRPLRMSLNAFAVMESIAGLSRAFDLKSPDLGVLDITSLLWKKDLKEAWAVTDATKAPELEVTIDGQICADASPGANLITVRKNIGLIFGLDLADRNVLNRLSSLSPQAQLLWWVQDGAVRYATRIQCLGGVRIQAAPYANFILGA